MFIAIEIHIYIYVHKQSKLVNFRDGEWSMIKLVIYVCIVFTSYNMYMGAYLNYLLRVWMMTWPFISWNSILSWESDFVLHGMEWI